MPHYTYLIIGGGMTGDAAIGGIREVDPKGSVGLIGADSHRPYDRPPLTKALWKGKPLESIWRKTDMDGVTLHLGRQARELDPPNKRVTDDQGTVYTFDKLLLATGGTPRRLPFGGDQIIYFRTLDDYERLRALTDQGQRFAIIGGGFIGSEIAAALTMNGKQVVMAFPEDGIGSRIFPADLAKFMNDFYRQKGVEVLAGTRVTGWEMRQGKHVLKTRGDQAQTTEKLSQTPWWPGSASSPTSNWPRLPGSKWITAFTSIAAYAQATLVSMRPVTLPISTTPRWMRRLRVEHEDNANTMGQLAGQAMAGRTVSYDHLPSFYSDLFELGFEAVGDVDARLETVADWKEPFRKGVVYYLRDSRVRGVLLWNVWEQVDAARKLIAETGPFRAENLRGRLPA